MKKIFLIGRKRTGIQSIVKALQILNYNSTLILNQYNSDKTSAIIKKMAKYEVCALMKDYTLDDLREIEAAYPEAVFILTEREPDAWYSSWIRYYSTQANNAAETSYKNKGHYVSKYYEEYNHKVKAHFKGREWRLLNFFYGKNASWQTLCSYLKKPIPAQAFPHENRYVKPISKFD